MNFKIIFSQFLQKKNQAWILIGIGIVWNFDRDSMESIDQSGKNGFLNNTESSNLRTWSVSPFI